MPLYNKSKFVLTLTSSTPIPKRATSGLFHIFIIVSKAPVDAGFSGKVSRVVAIELWPFLKL